MPMVIDRRTWLQWAGASTLPALAQPGLSAQAATPLQLAAAWTVIAGHQVGVLVPQGRPTGQVLSQIPTPTRAHGMSRSPDGSLLSVARRPGDWLLHWQPDGTVLRWHWIETDRAFNGHVLHSPDGRLVFTTETNLETGLGLIGVRDGRSLQKIAEWATHGMDPHELTWASSGVFQHDVIMVANGGIPSRPETGRIKVDLNRMDPSLTALDARTGDRLGQWRLADPRLSIRHLAWHRHADGHTALGLALQAEHEEPALKQAAPVLALWTPSTGLKLADLSPSPLAGYGGAIVSTTDGFAVSAPKSHAVGRWDVNGQWQRVHSQREACALAPHHSGLWVGGRHQATCWRADTASATPLTDPDMRIDNHWLAL
jgi:hypothetical protein